MEFLIVLAVLFAVVFVVTGPLRRPEGSGATDADIRPAADPVNSQEADAQLAELEARREAKYREIRDAELDRATGKLSQEDYDALDGRLRAEALDILHEIDRLEPHASADDPPPAAVEPRERAE